jgi:hypothetical protein
MNGTVSQCRPERKYLNCEWIGMSLLDQRLYEVLGNAILASHQDYDDLPGEAAMLYARHYWATAPSIRSNRCINPAKPETSRWR